MASTSRVKGPRSLPPLPDTHTTYTRSESLEMGAPDGYQLSRISTTESTASTSSTSSSSSTDSSESYCPCAWDDIEDCECCVYECKLHRRAHIRRQRKRKLPIKPLPKPPGSSSSPITRMVLAVEGRSLRIRKLPVPPHLIKDFPTVSPTTCSTPIPQLDDYPDSPDDGEINWEILINEIVNGRLSTL
ncbi:hypothetical protein VNI00_001030 [Paramarasmius palmivorus]|uniref:Uncharacterized protein n=1 Tax=Paramarasmius palmivorus TaxID=297713 RepID=A0AAW0E7P5_9AGAR